MKNQNVFKANKGRKSTYKFKGYLGELIAKAINGTRMDVDFIMGFLNENPTLATTRYVDYALSLVKSECGIQQLQFYLFHGTLIQRNYASLYFNRLGEWKLVKEAYEKGLIDEVQAFAR